MNDLNDTALYLLAIGAACSFVCLVVSVHTLYLLKRDTYRRELRELNEMKVKYRKTLRQ